MGNKYFTIKLGNGFKDYKGPKSQPLESIDALSSLNILVGPNNAGKSRFIRELLKTKRYQYLLKDLDTEILQSKLIGLQKQIREAGSNHNNVASFRANNMQVLKPEEISLVSSSEPYITEANIKAWNEASNLLSGLHTGHYEMDAYRGSRDIEPYRTAVIEVIDRNLDTVELLRKHAALEYHHPRKFYVPVLRSLNFIGSEVGHKGIDFYKIRLINTYGLGDDEFNLTIFTGLSLYQTVRSMLLGDIEDRRRIAAYEKFLSRELFNNAEVSLIPKEKDDVLHIKIGNVERAIYDLGDGIQSLIILTFPLFEVDTGIFFLEEPEMHLHPGLQRKLIDVLKKMTNHQYFITTHSNHFLDLTIDTNDTSVYTFHKNEEDSSVVEQVSYGDDNILQLLGARNSSVFLSNCTIWVEGITDRLYIRKFLQLYQADKEVKITEDIDYSFVEYGGDNITHWSFLEGEDSPIDIDRLCGKSFLITDEDGDKKMERKQLLMEKLGERYKLLECREIENILSKPTLERVLRSYEKRNNFTMPISRVELPYKNAKLGNYIHSDIFGQQTISRRGGYKEDSGTIKSKVDFCKRAIDKMSKAEMSTLAIDLSERIYNFVLSQRL